MSDNWDVKPSGTATIDPRNMVWELPPSGPGAPPPTSFDPTPPPPPRPPARGSAGWALVLIVALVLGFVGVSHLRLGSSPADTGFLQPTNPFGSSSQQSQPSQSVAGTSTLSSSEIDSIAKKLDEGVVDIDTILGYEHGEAAGTGMVLTSNGEILTNNHVIAGATKITATVVSTGKTYTAKVVGDDPTQDVAVIQLEGASGLKTISTAALSSVKVGDPVVAVGNAGGKGGTPSVAAGSVTSLNESITASDPGGANAQRLSGLIEVDAPIQAGDSGGPLANRNGDVIGMDSAAEVSGGARFRAETTSAGYAIPIEKALDIAKQIEAGNASSTVHIGLPAFLGVQLASPSSGSALGRGFGFGGQTTTGNTTGALITGVENGTPADSIGLQAGDTVTAVNGTSVGSSSTLSTTLQAQKPGDKVTITWTDGNGATHSATATLVAGPAD